MSEHTKENLLVGPEEGEKSGSHLVIKIRSGAMGGDFSVMEGIMKPGELLAPHTHENEDQAVIVLTGTLEFEVGGASGERFTAPAGSYVKKPRQVQHCFWNATEEPVRYVELSGREGFEGFVDSTTTDGTVKAVKKSVKDYGMTWHFERVPKLMAEHGLTGIAGVELPWEKLRVGSPRDVLDKLRAALTAASA